MFTILSTSISKLIFLTASNAAVNETVAQSQNMNDNNLNPLLISILVITLLVAVISISNFKLHIPPILIPPLKLILPGKDFGDVTGDPVLDAAIKTAGYSYESRQDIFYSNMNAWQRNMGYCQLYDEAAAPLGMIIDCEPIYFEYKGKRWLIEFWKGQYDLTTGCEVGVYTTDKPDLSIPGVFNGPFFQSASDEDRLKIVYNLKRNGEFFFTRKDTHWWLTGFKLGEFSQPSELTMQISITLKDKEMLNAFLKGLANAGYKKNEVIVNGITVNIRFTTPHTTQPSTRTKETDMLIQTKNKMLCKKYQDITKPYDNFPDKMKALREQSPALYKEILKMGKNIQLFSTFGKIKDYIN